MGAAASRCSARLFVVLVALIPLVFIDLPSQREAWSRVLLYALVALSLTVLTGWAGQLSLGQFAFVGVGGMTTAALVREGVGFIPALVTAGCRVGRSSRSSSGSLRYAGPGCTSRSRRSRSR